jgi:homoserine O-acetyltransferase/O-succinyltransferase
VSAARAATSDANHLLYLVKANQLANADPAKIKTPMLLLYSPTDLVFPAPLVEYAASKIAAGGSKVDTAQLTGPNGHLNGVLAIGQEGARISAFLAQ